MRGEFGLSEAGAQVPDNPTLHLLGRDAADHCVRWNFDEGIWIVVGGAATEKWIHGKT
jgi:hypothetical protein